VYGFKNKLIVMSKVVKPIDKESDVYTNNISLNEGDASNLDALLDLIVTRLNDINTDIEVLFTKVK
jgi:hypothetical protein